MYLWEVGDGLFSKLFFIFLLPQIQLLFIYLSGEPREDIVSYLANIETHRYRLSIMVHRADRPEHEENFEAIRQEVEAEIQNELGPEGRLGTDLEELEDLETELGLEEVDLDEADIDTFATDDTDDNLDADDDGIYSKDDEGLIDNRPQELSQSYGTGLQGRPNDRSGSYSRRSDKHFDNEADPILTGGDIDANYEQAAVVGDEAVGGTVATPDQDIVEELAAAVGVEVDDRRPLRVHDMLEQRDDRRWELDPTSSEDYQNRHGE